MEDEQDVERFDERRVRAIPARRGHLEEHVQEVLAVGEVVVRIDVRHPEAVAIGERRERGHLGDQPIGLLGPRDLVVDVAGVRIERGHRRDGRDQHPHRMRVVVEGVHHLLQTLVDHRVPGDVVDPLGVLLRVGELPVEEQVGDLEVAAVLRQLLDRVAAVAEDPLLPVDVGDAARARGGVEKGGVVGHEAEVVRAGLDLPQVDGADRPVDDGDLVGAPRSLVPDGERVAGGLGNGYRAFGGLRFGGAHGELLLRHYIEAGTGRPSAEGHA